MNGNQEEINDLQVEPQVPIEIKDYSVGCTTHNGLKIEHIFGKSEILIVFLCDNKRVHWEFDGDDDDGIFSNATAEYEALRSSLPMELLESSKNSLINHLASSLYVAINTGDVEQAFCAVKKRIAALLTPNQAKLRLILYCLLSACVLGVGLLALFNFIDWYHKLVFAAAGGGLIGAVFSLMQRNREVKIPQDNGDFYIFLQAFFVCVLGGIAGGMIYIIANSTVINMISNNNIYDLLLFSIFAGFSERMVPDLFNGISNLKSTKSSSDT